MGVAAATKDGISSSIFYLLAYGFTSLGAFAVVMLIRSGDGEANDLGQWQGLAKRAPVLAGTFAFLLFALAGIPITSGFTGKFAVFSAAIGGNATFLVVVALVTVGDRSLLLREDRGVDVLSGATGRGTRRRAWVSPDLRGSGRGRGRHAHAGHLSAARAGPGAGGGAVRLRQLTMSATSALPMSSIAGLDHVDPALERGVRAQIADVEGLLREAIKSDYPFVTETSRHLVEAGGKRFRPLVVLLAARLGDPNAPGVVPAAVAIELTHLSTLYHDDVMDEAGLRRGAESANMRWTNTVAILTGDFLFARASEIAADLGTEPTRILARTIAVCARGRSERPWGPGPVRVRCSTTCGSWRTRPRR